MPPIHIVAEMRFKSGQKMALSDALENLVKGSRAEKGNISYDLLESLDNPDHLFVIEVWESEQAIAEHNQMPHFKEFKNLAADKLDENRVTLLKKYPSV